MYSTHLELISFKQISINYLQNIRTNSINKIFQKQSVVLVSYLSQYQKEKL
jgi:hypothetical protein